MKRLKNISYIIALAILIPLLVYAGQELIDGRPGWVDHWLITPDIDTPDIDGGTMDDTAIGGTTPAAGAFTTLTTTGLVQHGAASGAANVNITPQSAIRGLEIIQAQEGEGIYIDSESTGKNVIWLKGKYVANFLQDVSGGRGLVIDRNLDEAGASALVAFGNNHANNTQKTLSIVHAGTGGGTGYGLHVDSENAAGPAVMIEGAYGSAALDIDGGAIRMGEIGADPTALADHAFLYAKDVGTVGNLFAADAAAAATQLTSHNFTLFEPDPNEPFPWSFYSENRALGKSINVDMAGMVRAVEALSGKTFIHYADIPKSVDLEVAYKDQWKREWIKENTTETEVIKAEALEMVEVDERVLYDVEVTDPKTNEIKIVKQGKKLGENITGYEFVDGEVKAKIEVVWEMEKVEKPQLKESVRFNTTDGKFYKKTIPTLTQAEIAAQTEFTFETPKWLKDRLIAQAQQL